jgi:hypothetical protein
MDSWLAPGEVTLPGKVLGNRVVWAGGLNSQLVNTIYMRDTQVHVTSVLAVARPGWRTDWVKGYGHRVVYMEATDEATDENPSPAWRMYVLDLDSRVQRLVASSTQAHGGVPPSPKVDGDVLIWAQGSRVRAGSSDILAVRLSDPTSHVRTLVSGRDVQDCGLSGDQVVFVSALGYRRDLFATSASGPQRVRQLTRSGRVSRANVGEGQVAFEEGPLDGDPDRQFVLSLAPHARPSLITGPIAPGHVAPSNITPGRGLVSWFTGTGTVVARTSSPSGGVTLTATPNIQIRFDWHQNTLLWGETKTDAAGIHNTLHVTTFR